MQRKTYSDSEYEKLKEIILQSVSISDYEESRKIKISISQQFKKMSGRILNVRVLNEESAPNYLNRDKQFSDIRVLADLDDYTFEKGLRAKEYAIF